MKNLELSWPKKAVCGAQYLREAMLVLFFDDKDLIVVAIAVVTTDADFDRVCSQRTGNCSASIVHEGQKADIAKRTYPRRGPQYD